MLTGLQLNEKDLATNSMTEICSIDLGTKRIPDDLLANFADCSDGICQIVWTLPVVRMYPARFHSNIIVVVERA
jgi:hypothetical protein